MELNSQTCGNRNSSCCDSTLQFSTNDRQPGLSDRLNRRKQRQQHEFRLNHVSRKNRRIRVTQLPCERLCVPCELRLIRRLSLLTRMMLQSRLWNHRTCKKQLNPLIRMKRKIRRNQKPLVLIHKIRMIHVTSYQLLQSPSERERQVPAKEQYRQIPSS